MDPYHMTVGDELIMVSWREKFIAKNHAKNPRPRVKVRPWSLQFFILQHLRWNLWSVGLCPKVTLRVSNEKLCQKMGQRLLWSYVRPGYSELTYSRYSVLFVFLGGGVGQKPGLHRTNQIEDMFFVSKGLPRGNFEALFGILLMCQGW